MGNGHYGLRGVVVALALCIIFTGCTSKSETAPELIDSVCDAETVRPVERGDMINIDYETGVVTPEYNCQYYKEMVKIQQILVEPGEFVNEGELIAVGDCEETERQLSDYRKDLEKENAEYELISTLQSQNGEDAENIRYNQLLHNNKVEELNKEILECEEIIENSKLYADCSGTVIYIKNLRDNSTAGIDENVVIIADFNSKIICLENANSKKYKETYIIYKGKKVMLEKLEYSEKINVIAEASGQTPKTFYTCTCSEMEIGDSFIVYFVSSSVQDVIMIGKDSIYSENGNEYAFVKNEKGVKERRELVTGFKNYSSVEVISGLEEGELVYYTTTKLIPKEGEELEIQAHDYLSIPQVSEISQEISQVINQENICSELYGDVIEVNISENDVIKEGDYLYSVNTHKGKAVYEEELLNYKEALEQYNSTVANLYGIEKELYILQNQEEVEKLKPKGDGSEVVKIYAKCSGTVKMLNIYVGKKVEVNDEIMSVITERKPYIKAVVKNAPMSGESSAASKEKVAYLGEKIKIGEYSGRVIGYSKMPDQDSLGFANNEKGDITYNDSGQELYPGFYIKMDNEDFYNQIPMTEVYFSEKKYKEVIVVPNRYVFAENNLKYVFVKKEDCIYKKSVMVNEEFLGGGNSMIIAGLENGEVIVNDNT